MDHIFIDGTRKQESNLLGVNNGNYDKIFLSEKSSNNSSFINASVEIIANP